MAKQDKPVSGRQYRLTGGSGVACLQNGNTWSESEVKIEGPRPIYAIARDITRTWKKVYFGAIPYLQAMRQLDSISDDYGCDSADSVVIYFLANAQTWRGPDARRIKAELKALRK